MAGAERFRRATLGVPIDNAKEPQRGEQVAAIEELEIAVQDAKALADAAVVAASAGQTTGNTAIGNAAAAQARADDAYALASTGAIPPRGEALAGQTSALPAHAYANGTAGVGATLTASANGALSASVFDNVAGGLLLGMRVAVMLEGAKSGLYTITALGSAGAPWVLTRAADSDTAAELGAARFLIASGATLAGRSYQCSQKAADIVVGTTALTFALVRIEDGSTASEVVAARNSEASLSAAMAALRNSTADYESRSVLLDEVGYTGAAYWSKAVGKASVNASNSGFGGIGQDYIADGGMSFDTVFIPISAVGVARNAAKKAGIFRVEVRNGGPTGTILATGSIKVDPEKTWFGNLAIPLDGAVTFASVTDAGKKFFVGYYVQTTAGGFASIGLVTSGVPGDMVVGGRSSDAYYRSDSSATWAAYSGDPHLAIELGTLTGKTVSTTRRISTMPSNAKAGAIVTAGTHYAIAGREFNIYLDNLIAFPRLVRWECDGSPSFGKQEGHAFGGIPNRFTWVPGAGDVGTKTLTIKARDERSGELVDQVSVSIVVAAANAKPATARNFGLIGDSRVADGVVTTEIAALSAADTGGLALTMIGLAGTAPGKHFGYSGYTYALFNTGASSPFGAGAFAYGGTLSANSLATPDVLGIDLGVNDVSAATDDYHAQYLAGIAIVNAEKIIAGVKAHAPSTKIVIAMTAGPSQEQNGYGNQYGIGLSAFQLHRAVNIMRQAVLRRFGGLTGSNIWIADIGASLDAVNNFPASAVAVNSRNTATVTKQSDGLHPANSGKYQFADAWWAILKSIA